MTHTMTSGNPAKLIIKFAIPLLIGNLFQQLYVMIDSFIVGRTLGVQALAAVGSIGSLNFLVLGFIIGLCNGLGIVAAQKFGAGDDRGLRRSVTTGLVIGATVAVILTLIFAPMAKNILELMQTPQEIIYDAYSYMTVLFWGLIISMMFNFLANIIRALGDSKTPLYFLAIACVMNIILDYVFIVGIGTGVKGAGFATLISQLASVIMCVVYMRRKFPILLITREDWRITRNDLKIHLRQAIPMGFQTSVIAIGAVVVQFVLNGLGHLSVAAYTAAARIDQLAILPIVSFGSTMGTYSAQNYGAGKIDRIKKGMIQCGIITMVFCVIIGLVNFFGGFYLAGLFLSGDAVEVQEKAGLFLRINGVTYVFLGIMVILRFALQGLGRPFMPMISSFAELGMRIFAAIILAGIWGFFGVCLSNPLAWVGALIPLVFAYIKIMKELTLMQSS